MDKMRKLNKIIQMKIELSCKGYWTEKQKQLVLSAWALNTPSTLFITHRPEFFFNEFNNDKMNISNHTIRSIVSFSFIFFKILRFIYFKFRNHGSVFHIICALQYYLIYLQGESIEWRTLSKYMWSSFLTYINTSTQH